MSPQSKALPLAKLNLRGSDIIRTLSLDEGEGRFSFFLAQSSRSARRGAERILKENFVREFQVSKFTLGGNAS
jgi:hypothetical protein